MLHVLKLHSLYWPPGGDSSGCIEVYINDSTSLLMYSLSKHCKHEFTSQSLVSRLLHCSMMFINQQGESRLCHDRGNKYCDWEGPTTSSWTIMSHVLCRCVCCYIFRVMEPFGTMDVCFQDNVPSDKQGFDPVGRFFFWLSRFRDDGVAPTEVWIRGTWSLGVSSALTHEA